MLKADLHTHTVNSGDGLCTLYEMAREASDRKLEILGITPHGPLFNSVFKEEAYSVYDRIPDSLFGVRILPGIEMNIIDIDGNVDVREKSFRYLRARVAGLHTDLGGTEKNTRAVINAIRNPKLQIISHPYCHYDTDIEKIADAAVKHNKLLELNNSTFKYNLSEHPERIENARKMVSVIQESNHMLIINSDAHIASDVGEDEHIMAHRKELGLRDRTIINNDIGELKRYLGIG